MKRRLILTAAAVTTMALVLSGCSNKKLIAQQESQIDTLQTQIDALEADVVAERQRNEQLAGDLNRALADQKSKEQVWIQQRDGMMEITLDGEVAFPSGSARITGAGQNIIDQIWNVIDNYPDRTVLIEGHTDNVPIAVRFHEDYKSNWELSSARAHAVLHYVIGTFGFDPTRIGAVGYGEFRPIDDNDSDMGRSRNRRVVITVGPNRSSSPNLP